MKKFSYKKGNSVIKTLKEPVIKKRKMNIDRILFILIIFFLCIWFFRFLYNRTVWVEGNGQILMKKVDVNFTNDIRVKGIFINEGDTVKVGDTLFNYFQDDFDSDASLVLKNFDRKEKLTNNLQEILKKIHLNKIRIKSLVKRCNFLIKQEEKITKLILLDVYTKNKLDQLLKEKMLVNNQIDLLKNELYFLRLQKKLINPKGKIVIGGGGVNYKNRYVSPIQGVIGQILKNSEESCYKTENVMTIHDVDKVFIKAYFNLKDLANLKTGTIVLVEFPDKTISKGMINKLYISTYKAPTEFQKKYEPTERNILTEIIPLYKEQIPDWGKFYKLNLKVKVAKF